MKLWSTDQSMNPGTLRRQGGSQSIGIPSWDLVPTLPFLGWICLFWEIWRSMGYCEGTRQLQRRKSKWPTTRNWKYFWQACLCEDHDNRTPYLSLRSLHTTTNDILRPWIGRLHLNVPFNVGLLEYAWRRRIHRRTCGGVHLHVNLPPTLDHLLLCGINTRSPRIVRLTTTWTTSTTRRPRWEESLNTRSHPEAKSDSSILSAEHAWSAPLREVVSGSMMLS